jgi:pyruvate dehydrogenase E1 component alpha subunit
MEDYRILSKEIELARAGNGPAFIEAYTYRWSGHYGPASDDLVGYRLDGELEHWVKNCPISILRDVLLAENMLTSKQEMEWVIEINHEIDYCFQYAKESPFPRNADWNDINYQNKSPLADKFLASFSNEKFDATQNHIQPKGY